MGDRELFELSRGQHGLVTCDQVVRLLSLRQLEHRLEVGLLEPVHRGVYRLAGSPVSWHQRLRAAVLAAEPGAAVAGGSP